MHVWFRLFLRMAFIICVVFLFTWMVLAIFFRENVCLSRQLYWLRFRLLFFLILILIPILLVLFIFMLCVFSGFLLVGMTILVWWGVNIGVWKWKWNRSMHLLVYMFCGNISHGYRVWHWALSRIRSDMVLTCTNAYRSGTLVCGCRARSFIVSFRSLNRAMWLETFCEIQKNVLEEIAEW